MSPETASSTASLLASGVKLPQHVVYRAFPTETVVLNLQTGRYHGLNPTGGKMLVALERARSVGEAASVIATEYDQPLAIVEQDLCELCSLLLARGLVELDAPAPH